MKKRILLAIMLLPCMVFAQNDLPLTSSKPFNKGNFKIDGNYSRLPRKHNSYSYSDFRVGVGYGITDWCVVGVFGSFGLEKAFVITGSELMQEDTVSYTNPVIWDEQIDHYCHYGLDVELHPLSIMWPSFYWIDLYCRGELGMRTILEKYVPEHGKPYVSDVSNDFLYGGSVGLAINPSRYFGLFYELAYNNLNKEGYYISTQKPKSFRRWGFNVRFPGPKKWQR